MRKLPDADPGSPGDPATLTPSRYLLWVANQQKRSMAAGAAFDSIWLLGLTLVPWAIGHAIDDGILADDWDALVRWVLLLLALSIVRAVTEPLRDRAGVNNWMQGAYRTAQLSGHHVTRLGQALRSRKSAGEIASVTGDSLQIGHVYYLAGGLVASIASYAVVAVILVQASLTLGLIVLFGVPAFTGLLFLLGKPIRKRQDVQRAAAGRMTSLGADVVAGLRIMRGIGGERHFLARYTEASSATREAGIAIAKPVAALEGLQVLVGGLLIVGVTWFGVIQTANGQLRPGELVSFYGYAGFLVMPVRVAAEAVTMWNRALVAAGRVLSVLEIKPLAKDSATPAAASMPMTGTVHDSASGLLLEPGTCVGVVAAKPADAADLLDRIARLDDSTLNARPVMWAGQPLTDFRLAEVRSRIVLVDPEPHLFTESLRSELDPFGNHDDRSIVAALRVAAAEDVLAGLPGGLDTVVVERGRAFSGGQRQRVGLTRAVLTQAPMLLLVEPTSAVDAHTEQRIADRLVRARKGMTTVVATSSPLLLREMDAVHLLNDGQVTATGTHHDLMANPDYRSIVERAEG